MSLSKSKKIWLIVISTPVVLLIIAVTSLKLYLTGERLKAIIIPKIEEATHRSVSIQDISFSILPSFAVSIDGLKLSNPGGMKFDREEFISLDNLRLKVKIIPLLSSKLEVDYVIVDHPQIYLETTIDGKNNYTIVPEVDKKEKASVTENKSTTVLLLSNLEIKDGEIEYINKKSDSRMAFLGFNLTSSAELKPSEQIIQFEGTTSIEKLSYGALKTWFLVDQPLSGQLRTAYQIEKDELKIDEVTVKLKDLPLTMSGTISKLRAEEMYFDLIVASPGVQLSQFLSLIPPEMLKAAKGMNSTGDVKFSTIIKGRFSEKLTPGVQGSFTVSNGKIQYASLPKSITNINVNGSFEKPESQEKDKGIGQFVLEKMSASLGNNQLTGKLTMNNFDDPLLKAAFSSTMNLNEIKEFYPLEQGTNLSGLMKADVSLEGKVKNPQSIKANGNMEFQNVVIKNANSPNPLRNLNGTITFNNQLIESKKLAMNIGESDLSIAFVMKNYLGLVMEDAAKSGGKPNASITLTSKQLRTVDLISEEKPQHGTDKKKAADQQVGLLPGFDIDANVNIEKLVTEKFEFENAHGSVLISNGVINMKIFSIKAFKGTILTKGTLDVHDLKKRPFNLDLDIVGVEANSILPNFTSFGKNIFGKFSMKTSINGDLDDTLGLNTKTLTGKGKVQIFDGKLLGFPLTAKLADFTGINELKEVDFKNWSNAFTISDGRVNITDLTINAGATDFLVNGSHGLDGLMSYNLNLKLPESVSDRLKLAGVASQLLQFFKDQEGRINLDFVVAGMTMSPTLKLDTKAQENMAKQALEKEKQKLLDQGKKKVEDELKKKVNEGLKKLFKKP